MAVALTLDSQKKPGAGTGSSKTPTVPVVNPSVAAAWGGPGVQGERPEQLGWLRPVAIHEPVGKYLNI